MGCATRCSKSAYHKIRLFINVPRDLSVFRQISSFPGRYPLTADIRGQVRRDWYKSNNQYLKDALFCKARPPQGAVVRRRASLEQISQSSPDSGLCLCHFQFTRLQDYLSCPPPAQQQYLPIVTLTILYEKSFDLKLSCNGIYNTA